MSIFGLVGIGLLVAMLLLGVPVGVAMATVGFLGLVYFSGITSALGVLATSTYSTLSSYDMSVVPLFVLMGYFAFHAGLSQDLYRAGYIWLGRLRGGLAMGTVAGCAGFAACCGSSVATAATMGAVALPEMRRYGYDDGLATGTLAAGGTIGILIPPSICLAVYGFITEQSIGRLFIAGIFPGLMEAASYILTIYIICRLKPGFAPLMTKERITVMEKLKTSGGVWGVGVLAFLVMGGIYGGIFTPTEAGGVGAFGAFILMLLKRKFSRENFSAALWETGQVTAMAFLILIGATIFGYLLAVSQLPMQVAAWLSALPVNRYLVLAGILFIFLALGCIMDTLAIILLVVPIVFPAILELGFNPIWFGVMMVRMSELGLITPPVGLNVYVIYGVVKDVSLGTIFRGIVPFLLADVVMVTLLIAFPQISLYLPSLMK